MHKIGNFKAKRLQLITGYIQSDWLHVSVPPIGWPPQSHAGFPGLVFHIIAPSDGMPKIPRKSFAF